MRWKRLRRSLKSKRDEEKFRVAQQELKDLQELYREGIVDLRYFDEAVVSLMPTVPYGWQPIGETIEIPSSRSGQLSLLGFLGLDGTCAPYTVKGTVDADVVVACFDHFAESILKATVVVIDNAPPHTSKKFETRKAYWESKGLFVYNLPPYCPELNLIEMLWRMIKYHWLPLKAYKNFKSLVEHVTRIMSEIGSTYTIEFAAAGAQ